MMLTINDYLQVVDWSRAQFAMTAIYHWLFVPLTLGLSFMCAYMLTRYYRTGDESWKRITKFWMTIFGINFAVGVATGLILEFEFGTNWSNYSHFVGDIFGAPLAIEGIMAFFMEATFIAVMYFGWGRVSKRFHMASAWLTAIGASLSALWILVANAWMQHPVGTVFNIATGRNEMISFWDVLLSPTALNKFFHTVTSSFVLGSVFVVGISAWFLIKGREQQLARRSMRIAAVFGLVSSVFVIITGHRSGQLVAQHQPMKLAAMEALYDGEERAGLTVISILRPEGQRTNNDNAHYFKIAVPGLLSWMSFSDTDAFVPGINDLVNGNPERGILSTEDKMERGKVAIGEIKRYIEASRAKDEAVVAEITAKFDPATPEGKEFVANYVKYMGYGQLYSAEAIVPPVELIYYCFRVMVGLGVAFIFMFALALWLRRDNRLEKHKWLLWLMFAAIPLAYLASQCGWAVTELGRQPWTIQDLLPTNAAVSKLSPASVKVTFFILMTLFAVLLVAEVGIMVRYIRRFGLKK